MIGTIMLANRFGIERGYSAEDRRLLEVLANNASVALQYDRLEQAVIKLRALQEQLHHQAYHDPLTGLPNRSLFMERVKSELADDARHARACCSSTSTTSRSSTTRSAMPSATRCWSRWPAACATPCARRTSSPGSAATSSRSCCRTSRTIAELRDVAARVLRASRRRSTPATSSVSVHLSVGIADSRRTATPDELIRERRPRHVPGEGQGQGPLRVLRPDDGGRDVRRHDLKEELAKAIERERDRASSTSRSSSSTRAALAAEALVRWQHPVRGLVRRRSSSRWPRRPG